MTVVGLTGRKFHGKDTAARRFVQHGYVQLRFADPLKEMLRAFYRTVGMADCDIERRIEGGLKEVPCNHLCGKTPRYAMQTLGTEWGRACIDNKLWVNTLVCRAKQHDKVVVSDVRFGNECDAIASLGGRVCRVDAGVRVPQNEHSNHASEQAIDLLSVDVILDNSGTEFALGAAVDTVCRDLAAQPSGVGIQETAEPSATEARMPE